MNINITTERGHQSALSACPATTAPAAAVRRRGFGVDQTGAQVGMQTMDTSLAQLVRENKITRELAEARSSAPEELRRLMGTVRVA